MAGINRHSLRFRLASWFSTLLLLTLLAYTFITYSLLRHMLYSELDEKLDMDAAIMEACLLGVGEQPIAEWLGMCEEGRRAWQGSELWADVFCPDQGDMYFLKTPEDKEARLPRPDDPGEEEPMYMYSATVNFAKSSEVLRLHQKEHQLPDNRRVVIRVGRSESQLRDELRESLISHIVGLPLVILLAVGVSFLASARVLAPVNSIIKRLKRITADSLDDRLTVRAADSELELMIEALNKMLVRLDYSFQQLRSFTGDISHELRTPLTSIRSLGEVGLQTATGEEDLRETIGAILEENAKMETLIETLLMLARGAAGGQVMQLQPVDLGDLVLDVSSLLAVVAEEKEQTLFIDAQETVAVKGDRTILRQALINLVDNAIKYSPQGSRISIGVSRENEKAVISVADSGPGIPESERENIFERFYRLPATDSTTRQGSGLGLSIVRWAVGVHNGRVDVRAGQGGGSVFRIVLPRSPRLEH
ncbi:MAG: ATP-binding protein [Syntrophobacteraceae bacterium]